MSDLLELVVIIFVMLTAIIVSAFLCICLWCAGPAKWACEDFGGGMQLKTDYRFWYGCFVTMPGGEILPHSIAKETIKRQYQHRLQLELKEAQ